MSKTAIIKPVPEPEPAATPRRRRFTAEFKARILAEADAAVEQGQIGALLRRDGLYSSHLVEWRRRRAQGGIDGLAPKKMGRPPKNPTARANDKELERLRRENARLQERLRRSEIIVEAQTTWRRCWRVSRTRTARTANECRRRDCRRGGGQASLRGAAGLEGHTLPSPEAEAGRGESCELAGSDRGGARGSAAGAVRPPFHGREPWRGLRDLLDEGVHLASESTMYRILRGERAVGERRWVRRHPNYAKPELVATGPNQVRSWDITKVRGPDRRVWYHLYVIIDIFSRKVVGWVLAANETAALAERFIADTLDKEGVAAGELVLYAERGTSGWTWTAARRRARWCSTRVSRTTRSRGGCTSCATSPRSRATG